MSNQMTPGQLQDGLAQFYGSDTIYRHPLFQMLYTEGVKFLAEQAGAWWLVEAIFSWQLDPLVRAEEFQSWKITVTGNKATLVCTDGDDNHVVTQDIEFTDFPLPSITLWFENRTAMLPDER